MTAGKGVFMKKFITKALAMALAVVIAITTFSTSSLAASAADTHRRDLTAEEIVTIKTMFKADQYAKYYPDVVKELGSDEQVLFNHFITFGIWEQRQPSVAFNVDVYASRNPDLQSVYGDDIVAYYIHYATHPVENGWRATPTPHDAIWNGCTIYSVYDFVKGQTGPKKGAIPVLTPNSHPRIDLV
ncbi:hypothetical protein SAMN02910350_01390 [Pseudobutyrivibrio xylanivorans]|uniref:DUF5104 domain-containing protein n=2 Tax=Pseudobutyrivibrio xylanivorans TaxID=185007 RepID=A0A1G5RX32_PSEXY|nr:hypothetical protein SAMN02910350_01390 [Pseudobutyrivibrio xylanivorans]